MRNQKMNVIHRISINCSNNFRLVWTLFFAFTFLHVFANYRALRALNLESFNRSRLLIALKEFLIHHKIPTVREVNQQECLIVGFGVKGKA